MKIKKIAIITALCLMLSFLLAACGAPKLQGAMNGKWYYIHDLDNPGLVIKDNGTAILDGQKYECDYDDANIYLTDKKSGKRSIKYTKEGSDGIFLYKTATYKYQGTGTPEGLIGTWVDVDNGRSSYEFTSEGTFREDSYIPGYYYVDEERGTIKCVYNDHYVDTTIFYTLWDDLLIVEYPWAMVRQGK